MAGELSFNFSRSCYATSNISNMSTNTTITNNSKNVFKTILCNWALHVSFIMYMPTPYMLKSVSL